MNGYIRVAKQSVLLCLCGAPAIPWSAFNRRARSKSEGIPQLTVTMRLAICNVSGKPTTTSLGAFVSCIVQFFKAFQFVP